MNSGVVQMLDSDFCKANCGSRRPCQRSWCHLRHFVGVAGTLIKVTESCYPGLMKEDLRADPERVLAV